LYIASNEQIETMNQRLL